LKRSISEYTTESWQKYEEALVIARLVLNKEGATKFEIDNAVKLLKVARDALVKIPQVPPLM
jgi:hypothetical protein